MHPYKIPKTASTTDRDITRLTEYIPTDPPHPFLLTAKAEPLSAQRLSGKLIKMSQDKYSLSAC